MALTEDMSYNGDQAFLVQDLIDHHQAKEYGDYGLDTTAIGAHSVTIEQEYKRIDLINVYDEIYALGEQDNGFDIDYDPPSGEVVLHHPQRGSDKTATVILDARGITNPNIAYSLAAKQFASSAIGAGSNHDTDQSFFSEQHSAGLRQNFGLSYITTFVSGNTTQGQVNGYTVKARQLSNNPYFVPSREYYPVLGADVDDFEPGDAVSFVYDPGFGELTIAQEVKNQAISVGPDGLEKLNVEFV